MDDRSSVPSNSDSASSSRPIAASVPGRLDKVTGRFHLWAHGSCRELELTKLLDRGVPDLAGGGRPEVGLDRGDIGKQEERVGSQQLGEQGGGPILVDDGLDPTKLTVFISHDRNAAAPRSRSPRRRLPVDG